MNKKTPEAEKVVRLENFKSLLNKKVEQEKNLPKEERDGTFMDIDNFEELSHKDLVNFREFEILLKKIVNQEVDQKAITDFLEVIKNERNAAGKEKKDSVGDLYAWMINKVWPIEQFYQFDKEAAEDMAKKVLNKYFNK